MNVESFVKEKVVTGFTNSGGNTEAAFDPASILIWISVAKELIGLLQSCKQAKDVPGLAKNPNVFQRAVLRNTLKDKMGIKGFFRHGRASVDAFLKAGADLTADEVQDLYDEV